MRKIKPLHTIILSSALAALLSSCGPQFSLEVKDFMKGFSFSKCVEKYLKVDYHFSAEVKENDVVTSTKEQVVSFDLTQQNFTYSSTVTCTGEYVVDDVESKIEQYYYSEEVGSYIHTLSVNGNETKDNVEKVVVRGKATSFLGEEYAESGLYTGGIYYGGQVVNMISMHDFFSVDYDRNLLVFSIENYVVRGSVNTLYYEVNEDGMLNAWHQLIDDGIKLLTSSIEIAYYL